MEKQKSAVELIRKKNSAADQNRRKIAALSALGLIDFSIISLYQLGFIKHLPDLPGSLFDSDKVNASKDAQIMGFPDGVVSLGMYTANILLATAAIKKGKKKNIFDYLMGAVTLGQAAGAGQYVVTMATVQKKICPYCVTGAAINFASLRPLLRLFR